MPNWKVTNTAKLKGRELLRRPRFPALFPADRGALKPWAVGYLYRQDHRKPGLRVIAISGSHQVTIFQYFGQNLGRPVSDRAIVTKVLVIGAGFFQAMPLG